MREVEKEAYLVKCRIINDFFSNSKFHLVLLLDITLHLVSQIGYQTMQMMAYIRPLTLLRKL